MKNRLKWPMVSAGLTLLSPLMVWMTGCKAPSEAEIKSVFELINIETKWVMKEYRQWPNPVLRIVPVVSFNVKNNSQETLLHVNFNALFKERDAVENLGDCFLADALRKDPVPPGGVSKPVVMKSNLGVYGSNLEAIKTNPMWRIYHVKIFVQWKGSGHVLLGEWPVSKMIDFKEPEPVHMGKEKKEPEPEK